MPPRPRRVKPRGLWAGPRSRSRAHVALGLGLAGPGLQGRHGGRTAGAARARRPRDADPPSCRTVRFSDVGWTDVTSTTALTAELLRNIGYTPTITVLSVPVTFASMKNKDIDVFLGNWMPAQEADRAPYDADGSVDGRSGRISSGAKYTLAVPAYIYAPGLKDFNDIHRFADRAQSFDLRHRARQRRQSAGAQDAEGQPVRSGRFQADRVERAGHAGAGRARLSANKEPIVFLAWEPHPMNMRFDIKYLTGGDAVFGAELRRRDHLYRDAQGLRQRVPERRPLARESQIHAARRERNDGGDSRSARAARTSRRRSG